MRAHFTGVRASGMALTGFARVPGFLLSFATMVILMLTPRVHHLDARAEPSLGADNPGQLSGALQEVLPKATEGTAMPAGDGTGAPSGPDKLPYQAAVRGSTVPLPGPTQAGQKNPGPGFWTKKFFVTDFDDELGIGADERGLARRARDALRRRRALERRAGLCLPV